MGKVILLEKISLSIMHFMPRIPTKNCSGTFKFFMPSVHTGFIQPTKKKILANTDLTPTTAGYVIPCKY